MPEAIEDKYLNLSHINREFRSRAQANGWQAYHTPKNLAAAIAVEASELLAEFQWLTPDQSGQLTPEQKIRVGNEIADVVMYVSELCAALHIDLADAIDHKIHINKIRANETKL